MSKIDWLQQANNLADDIVRWRRDFHQHPELAFKETRTARIVAEELQALGMEVQTGVGQTGVVAVLEGAANGPTVLVRADMDALPISTEITTEYASQTPGVMHACGHDGHTAVVLGVARMFAAHRDQMKGRIKFVFQPAEEIGSGARAMKADGVLQDPRPDVSLGLHLWNDMPVGELGVASGPVMAGSGDFEITITGKGGHGAAPHMAIDPVVCAAQIILGFQTIVARTLDPLDTAVLSVTRLHTGTANNIIPQTAVMGGTFRFFKHSVAETIQQRMREIVEGVCAAMNCTAQIQIKRTTEPVANADEVAAPIRHVFESLGVSPEHFHNYRTMGSEDVGEFMSDIPGMFFFVGSANPERGLNYPHHHPRFDFDEAALPLSAGLLAAAVAHYVMDEA
ncbi:MAG: amidohydrolase [Anaerolineae bacterium]